MKTATKVTGQTIGYLQVIFDELRSSSYHFCGNQECLGRQAAVV